MSSIYDELKSLFINDPASAIKKCQDIIASFSDFNTYQEFYSYHLQHPHVSTCQREWTDGRMSIHCFDCGIDKQSCVCLQCFVNGNHQGHDYVIYPNTTGNCDCGDVTLCKPSGFCKYHQGIDEDDHPENYLDEKLRNELTDVIFKAAFASFPRLQNKPETKVNLIFQFLSSFLKFGDGFRRLIAISLTERIKFDILIGQIFDYKKFFNELFKQLCGNLLNDQLFKVNFARSNFKLLLSKTIPNFFSKFHTHIDDSNYSVWNYFWFHSFAPQPIKLNITRYDFDWVTFSLSFTNYMKNFFSLRSLIKFDDDIPNFFSDIPDNMYNASLVQPNEQTQRFFDELFTTVLNCGTNKKEINDTIVSASFFEMHENHYYYSMHVFNIFYPYMNCFKLKKNLKFDKLIEELDRSLDISQIYCLGHNELGKINDLFVSNYIDKINDISSIFINKESSLKVEIEDHFKSFHNGGAFYFTLPLFDSLCYLLRLDNMSRIKISRLLLQAKFKKLRIQLAIVALKKLCALLCCHQSLVSKRNFALINILSSYLSDSRNVHYGFPLVFPLFQLLIGLQSEDDNKLNEFSIKEFFAFEMARELGIFDDYTSKEYKDENVLENQEQMIVSFLYLSLLLNIERTLFNFNAYYFMEEQIISALKQGISSPAKLNNVCNMNSQITEKCHSYFNTIISKVAKMNSNNGKKVDGDHDISFSLKDGIECKPLSAIVPFNDQKVLLNKEISKHPDVLIKIQEFDDEDDYFFNTSKEVKANPEDENNEDDEFDSSGIKIKLKEFLSTPTVLAITYHTLRMSAEKAELNDHLAMNILILISKFVEDFDSKPYESTTVIHYDSTINDLISKMKKVLFDFKIDEDGNATLTNTLNKQNFNTLLNLKIGSDKLEPKSFIDILLNKGEIGKSVLRQLSVDIENDENQNEKQLIKERNKQKARKLKENIINKYKSIISNYYTNDADLHDESTTKHGNGNHNDDDDDDNEDVCSICSSNRKDQILCYPLYIYRTKLPFIVDKPPFEAVNEGSVLAVDEDNKNTEQHEFIDLFLPKKSKKDADSKSKNSSSEKVVNKRVTNGNNFVIQFSICQHHIHQSCMKRKTFKCPIDRSEKNGFLPSIDVFQPNLICVSEKVDSENIEKPIKDSISGFIENFTSFFENKESNIFVELAKSIAGLISTFEIRLRNFPDCLDSSKNKILARNLFLTAWYSYRMMDKPELFDTHSKRLTLFQKFILKLIECDQLEGISSNNDIRKAAFQQILSSLIENKENFVEKENEKRREKEIFLFLRRVCLASHFLLNIEISDNKNQLKFIDWDEILSVSNLSARFNTTFSIIDDDFEFKPIVFAKLPKEFISFIGEPFNFPIDLSMKFTVYNILDYNSLIQNFDDFNDDENENSIQNDEKLNEKIETFNSVNLSMFFKYTNKNYPSVLLLIGINASDVIVIDKGKTIMLKPFYLDKFGCPDVGFKRYHPLFLNEEKYGRIMDLVMSGDFSFYVNNETNIFNRHSYQ